MHGPAPPVLDIRWEPEALIILGHAYDDALAYLSRRADLPPVDRATRERLAARLFELWDRGEVRHWQLVKGAVRGVRTTDNGRHG